MPRVIVILGIFVGTRHRDPRNITYTYYDGCMVLTPLVTFTSKRCAKLNYYGFGLYLARLAINKAICFCNGLSLGQSITSA